MVSAFRDLGSLPVQRLTNTDVHIWRASLKQSMDVVDTLSVVLSREEAERAERFYFKEHRQFFIVGRGILRILLSHYTGSRPQDLTFEYTETGKPFLASQGETSDLYFNLSHSGGVVLYAFSLGKKIGVDIEYMRTLQDMEEIARYNFSPQEYKKFLAVPKESRSRAFYNCWTRKEAFIKAIGEGISFPLQQFNVSLRPDEPAELLSVYGSVQKAKHWSMHDLKTLDGYVAALVVEGKGHIIQQYDWTPPEALEAD